MSRVTIVLPGTFFFSAKIPVRIGDMNRGNHLGHESFLVIIEEARNQLLNSLGYTESDIMGSGLIMTDASIVYLKQVQYRQTLKVEIAVKEFTSRGFEMVYRVTDRETGVEAARARTGFLFFDYQKQKVVTVPPEFRQKFS